MSLLPEGLRSLRIPAAVWALTLPVWAALAAATEYVAPAASSLWVPPLFAASVLLVAIPLRITPLVRVASLFVAIVAVVLWLRDGVDTFGFAVALLGRFPLVTPIWLYPALVTLIAVMIVPPLAATLSGALRGRLLQRAVGASLLIALAGTMSLAYVADAYTHDRPLRRVARYVHDVPLGQAWWSVGGNEPGLDLDLPSAEAARWRLQPRADATTSTGLVAPLVWPFVFRAEAPPADAPVDVAATIETREGTTDLEIAIVPRQESLSASVWLPPNVEPTQANLTGIRVGRARRWRATFAAVPATGIAFRATVPADVAARLSETILIVSASRAPGADQPRVPGWLPQRHTEWSVDARWILQPPLTTRAPVATPALSRSTPAPPAGHGGVADR